MLPLLPSFGFQIVRQQDGYVCVRQFLDYEHHEILLHPDEIRALAENLDEVYQQLLDAPPPHQ
ncbi:MAG TPA: hypothetical protein VGO67_07910 [Verrucomicrobiae bacterium]